MIDDSYDMSEAYYSLKEVKKQLNAARARDENTPHIYRIINELLNCSEKEQNEEKRCKFV